MAGRDGRSGPGFGIYVHWPWCQSKCPYCDFNSHVARAGSGQADRREAAWRDAIGAELAHMATLAPGATVSSIFFGGGTPSLMTAATLGAVLDRIAALWPVAGDAEVTLEANPTSAEADRFAGYRAAGVNRISLGVQALDDAALATLGRKHDTRAALDALQMARRHFSRVSFDLIYARPNQSIPAWQGELARALALNPDHLSLYQLTIEAGTPFAALHARGQLAVPEPEIAETFYTVTQEMCEAAGLAAYEVSNHATQGAESRHNLLYWRAGDWAGVGPGAHGRLTVDGTRLALATERHPNAWMEAVARRGHGLVERTAMTREAAADEMLLMGLRLAEGLDLGALAQRTGLAPAADVIAGLERARLVHRPSPERLAVTARGRMVMNRIVLELASALGPACDLPAAPRIRSIGQGIRQGIR